MKWRWACAVLVACSGGNHDDVSPTIKYLTLSANELDFAAPLGVTTTATLTATNDNDVPAYAVAMLDPDFTEPSFTIATTDCPVELPPGASCSVTVAFMPDYLGYTGIENAIGVGNSYAMLVGQGGVALTISPITQDFGSVYNDKNSAPFVFTIENTTAVAQHPKPQIMNNSTWGFVISDSTCAEIPPMGTCTLSLELQGGFTGTRTAKLDVDGADAALTGLDLNEGSPHLYDDGMGNFGVVGIYAQPPIRYIQIYNGTHTDLPQIDIAFVNAALGVFTIQANSCTSPVADGASCYVTMRATTTGVGMSTAMMTATTPGVPDHMVPVSVDFVDDGPRIAITPSGVVACTLGQPISFSIANASSAFRYIDSVTVPAPYQISYDTCAGNSLPPNSTFPCTFMLELVTSGDPNQVLTVSWDESQQDTVTLVPAN